MTDEFADKTTKQDDHVDDAIITQLNERLAILEAKSSNVDQRFDLLERTIGDLSTTMHKAIDQLDPLYRLALELQNKQQAKSQTAAQQTAAPQGANTAQSVTSPAAPEVCEDEDGGMTDDDYASLDLLTVPTRPNINAISGTANNGSYGGGCGGSSSSSSSEIIDFTIDAAKVVGTVAAVGIAGYAAYKGGQWLVEKISEWHK